VNVKRLVFNPKELPVTVILKRDDGAQEVYQLHAASQKFGMSLQKVVGDVREVVLRERQEN